MARELELNSLDWRLWGRLDDHVLILCHIDAVPERASPEVWLFRWSLSNAHLLGSWTVATSHPGKAVGPEVLVLFLSVVMVSPVVYSARPTLPSRSVLKYSRVLSPVRRCCKWMMLGTRPQNARIARLMCSSSSGILLAHIGIQLQLDCRNCLSCVKIWVL